MEASVSPCIVASDVGRGQQQYYAFLDVPQGGDDKFAKCEEWSDYRAMLLDRFSGWCPAVLERLECTKPEAGTEPSTLNPDSFKMT